jgi:hypothetical protein
MLCVPSRPEYWILSTGALLSRQMQVGDGVSPREAGFEKESTRCLKESEDR